MTDSVYLEDLCSVLRSKNAGPFLITLDVIFKDKAVYELVKRKRLITQELVAQAYSIPLEDVAVVEYVDAVGAVKATNKRRQLFRKPWRHGLLRHEPGRAVALHQVSQGDLRGAGLATLTTISTLPPDKKPLPPPQSGHCHRPACFGLWVPVSSDGRAPLHDSLGVAAAGLLPELPVRL